MVKENMRVKDTAAMWTKDSVWRKRTVLVQHKAAVHFKISLQRISVCWVKQ